MKKLDVVFAADDAYLVHAMAMVQSVIDSCANGRYFPRFWLLRPEALKVQKVEQFIQRLAGHFEFEMAAIPQETLLKMHSRSILPELSRISDVALARIFWQELIPSFVSRVLYLDCDIICVGSLDELFEYDLQSHTLAAAQDCGVELLADAYGLPGLDVYNHLSGLAPYFNSGVLLIDRKSWELNGIQEKTVEYLSKHAAELRFCDQDALNFSCYGAWKKIDKKWNYMKPWRLEERYGGTITNANIIHFAGDCKVWERKYIHGEVKDRYTSLVRRILG